MCVSKSVCDYHNITAGYEVRGALVFICLPNRCPYAGHSACGLFNTLTYLHSWMRADKEKLVVKQSNRKIIERQGKTVF